MPTIAEYKQQIALKKALKNNGFSALQSFLQPKEAKDVIEKAIAELLPSILKETVSRLVDDEVFLQYNRLCLAKHRMDRKCHISYERVEQNLLNNIKELELKIRIKKINKIKKNIK